MDVGKANSFLKKAEDLMVIESATRLKRVFCFFFAKKTTFVFLAGLASCQAAPQAPVSSQAAPPARVVLKLYSGSSTGLVVGEAPTGGNPGPLLPDQSFVENPGLAKTFIWSFAPNATMLDSSCATITHTQAINIANSPVANAAVFTKTAPISGQEPAIKVQILPAKNVAGASC